jgi:hypothetical protein
MKYVKGYHRFVKESKQLLEKNAIIVEKQILNDFSKDFWNLCVKSSIFTEEEKQFITENLTSEEVKLNEEWEWLDKAVTYAKDKGGKVLDTIKSRIEKLAGGIKQFVASMVEMAKNLWSAMITGIQKFAKELSTTHKEKAKVLIEKAPEKEKMDEFNQLKSTLQHWGLMSATVAQVTQSKAGVAVSNLFVKAQADAEKQATDNLKEAEALEESIFFGVEEDILVHFYNINEAEEAAAPAEGEEEQKKSVWDWILKFLGQKGLDPEVATGKKLLWWGKFFLKVLGLVFSPLVKLLEAVLKYKGNKILQGVSWITKQTGGPGVYEFVVMGGVVAGLIGIVAEGALLNHIEFPGSGAMHSTVSWVAHTLEHAGDLVGWYKIISYTLTAFCLGMTVYEVCKEIEHLVHATKPGHGEEDKSKTETPEAKPEGGESSGSPTPVSTT